MAEFFKSLIEAIKDLRTMLVVSLVILTTVAADRLLNVGAFFAIGIGMFAVSATLLFYKWAREQIHARIHAKWTDRTCLHCGKKTVRFVKVTGEKITGEHAWMLGAPDRSGRRMHYKCDTCGDEFDVPEPVPLI